MVVVALLLDEAAPVPPPTPRWTPIRALAAVPASLHVANRRMRVSRCFGGFGNASVVF